MAEKNRAHFSSKIGFILAAASSAVGLGNIWRFPYLAAEYGGGIFLLTYIGLAVTFGFALLIIELAIGRKTGLSSIAAFKKLGQKFNISGVLGLVIPMIITPYYCLIGGWVAKYLQVYVTGGGSTTTTEGFFSNYISTAGQPLLWMTIFLAATGIVVLLGVDKGIEKASVILMPILLVLIVIIAIYVATRPGAGAGLAYYFKPDFSKISIKLFLAALGQLFYSLSIAMGILVTYGSYMSKKDNLETSALKIEFFDSFVGILAGMIIVPSVYIFSNGDPAAMSAGPGLMFITLPKIFASFAGGGIIGTLFFILTLFAALTSSISLMEAVVSNIMDKKGWGRKKTTLIVLAFCWGLALLCALGYSAWSSFNIGGMQILDLFDFASNSVLMPILALITCIFVGYFLKPKAIVEEVEQPGVKFKAKGFFIFLVKFACPIGIALILISSILQGLGFLKL